MSEMSDFCRKIVHARWFHHLVILTIIVAGVLAGIETNPAALATYGPLLQVLDRIVLGVFIVEAILKLTAHCPRPWNYFRDGWNVFDFTVVVLCLLPDRGRECAERVRAAWHAVLQRRRAAHG